jgi:hypothetical protein
MSERKAGLCTWIRLAPVLWLACGVPIGPDNGGGRSGGTGNEPAIAIVSPADGEACEADKHDKSCPVVVAISNAVLASRGTCGGSSGSCGHIVLFVDGTACGSPNNEASSTQLQALFGRCKKFDGPHTLNCELRDDRDRTLARSRMVTVQVKRHGGDDDDD